VQQIAYRLIVVGLVEEHFLIAASPTPVLEEPTRTITVAEPVQEPSQKPNVSQSFLKSLVSFLRSK
jgi:hypothetical protein